MSSCRMQEVLYINMASVSMANKQLCDEYKKLCSRGLNKC